MSQNFFDKMKSLVVETHDEPVATDPHVAPLSDADFLKIMSTDDGKTKAYTARVAAEAVAAAPAPEPAPKRQIADTDGNVDFGALYEVGNIAASPIPAEKTLELIASLPATLPIDVKRQTVRISVQAMGGSLGATPQTIVADARAKSDAIASFLRSNDADTAQYVQTAEAQIRDLEARTAKLKATIDGVKSRRERVQQSCQTQTQRLQEVVGFFAGSESPTFPPIQGLSFPT